jgi:hypothetical protein
LLGIHAGVHHRQPVLGQRQRQRQLLEQLPIGIAEPVQQPVMERRHARALEPGLARPVGGEQLGLVVAEHGLAADLSEERQDPQAVGAPRHQIAHEQHAIVGARRDRVEQAPQLGDAAMDVTHDDRARHWLEF